MNAKDVRDLVQRTREIFFHMRTSAKEGEESALDREIEGYY
jgi:hypothetical protein